MKPFILSIDQGTTSSRAIAFAQDGSIVALHQKEYPQIYPHNGWVEHDPEAIWATTLSCCQNVISDAEQSEYILACIGITNQRETTVVWDRDTGKPVYNAIVWQDRRTSSMCLKLKEDGYEPLFQQKTGLVLDPYFSATKIAWILDHAGSEVRKQAAKGMLAFGTIDSFLLWRLAQNTPHFTDATNASRTLLFNIHSQEWDEELLEILNIPSELLPEVKDSMDDFGYCKADILGSSVPINSMIGDQHAAMIGQGCFERGAVKATYGTGCFVMAHTGQEAQASQHKLLTTMAYRMNGKSYYAMEGSIFIAGAAMQWLRDGISILDDVSKSSTIAEQLDDTEGVVVVPSFTGIGAPYWKPDARGAILGMTRDTRRNQIIRATLESVAYQTYDLFDAMIKDGINLNNVYVDGGMSQNEWLMGYIASLTSLPICRRKHHETTALGAAFLAGIKEGIFTDMSEIEHINQKNKSYDPADIKHEKEHIARWHRAVQVTLEF